MTKGFYARMRQSADVCADRARVADSASPAAPSAAPFASWKRGFALSVAVSATTVSLLGCSWSPDGGSSEVSGGDGDEQGDTREPTRKQISAASIPGLFGDGRPTGSLSVSLRPTEVVTPGSTRLVTFGVPFPRGAVSDPKLVRVYKRGVEIPAHVDVASPWRSTRPEEDGKSVRVVRVQVETAFAGNAPEEIVVEWGRPRTKDVSALTPPRRGWHVVTSGSFTASDRVSEPDVYALLPKQWLTQSGLGFASEPFADDVREQRAEPSAALRANYRDFTKVDHAINNFFYTVVNRDDPRVTAENRNQYRTFYESWLYDRAGTFFHDYLRSGFFTHLREAVQAAEFYKAHIHRPGTPGVHPNVVGMFDLKVGANEVWPGGNGAMYSYAEPFAYAYWMTGDDSGLEYLPWVVGAYDQSEPTRWSPTASTWTERHTAFQLLANVVAFEATGAERYRREMLRIVDDFIWHQNGAGGQVKGIDGALWHTGDQHGDGSGIIASPWMSALTVNAMARAFMVTEDKRIAEFIVRMGNFEKAACKVRPPSDVLYNVTTPMRVCDYVTSADGRASEAELEDAEHSLDVANVFAWAAYFADFLGRPDATLRQHARELFQTYSAGVDYFTRPSAPETGKSAFRVAPDRKYAWQYHNTGTFSWLMNPKPPARVSATVPSNPESPSEAAPGTPAPAGSSEPTAPAPGGSDARDASPATFEELIRSIEAYKRSTRALPFAPAR
jgi:hypothetical protein